eukprot:241675_1
MAKPVQHNNKKAKQQANVEAIVQSVVSSNVAEYEKILLQIRVFKEKRMYSNALLLYKKGIKIVNQQLLTQPNGNELHNKLTLTKARYYHYASSIFYEMRKYVKAMSFSTRAVNCCKGILDNSNIEMMRFKEVLALSYKEMEQNDEALRYFEPMYHGLNVQIKSLKNDVDVHKKENDSLKELIIWKGDVTYHIAMIYNTQKKFVEASKYAKECCVIRNVFAPNTDKQILALILVSVIVSCPRIAQYKLALDNLEKAKTIINSGTTNEAKQHGKSDHDLKQYLPRVQRLSTTVLTECVRWSKVTNSDLDHYLKTGQRKKSEKK